MYYVATHYLFFSRFSFMASPTQVHAYPYTPPKTHLLMASSATGSVLHKQLPELCHDVYCLRKPRTARVGPSSVNLAKHVCTTAPPHQRLSTSPPLTYDDVVEELESDRWTFAPYPRCDRGQLLQVHAYWVMVPRQREGKAAGASTNKLEEEASTTEKALGANVDLSLCSATSAGGLLISSEREEDTKHPPIALPRFSCVVGVVWVRLSAKSSPPYRPRSTYGSCTDAKASKDTGAAVEGYLQVVLTHPEYRRRGLASRLLRTCLESREAPANAFASNEDSAGAYTILRWHLHTLMAPPSSSYARRHVRVEGKQPATAKGREKEGSDADVVEATLSMYRRLGFTERRYLYKYYAGKADAVELVKQCT